MEKKTYEEPLFEVVVFEEEIQTGSEGSVNVNEWWADLWKR